MNLLKSLVCLTAVLVTLALVGCEHGDDGDTNTTNITNNVTQNTYVTAPPPIEQTANGGGNNSTTTVVVTVTHSFIVANGSSHNVPVSFNGGAVTTILAGKTKNDWVTPKSGTFDFTYDSLVGLDIHNPLPGGKSYVVKITDSLTTPGAVEASFSSF